MKTLRLLMTAAVFSVFLTGVAMAQTPMKIATMDLSKVFDNYEKTKAYDTEFEAKYKAVEQDRNQKIEKLREANNKLALVKEDEKMKLQKEIDQMTSELRDYDRQKEIDFQKERNDKVREILLEVEKVVSEYSKAEKIDIVLNDRVLIYGNEILDISETILNKLNESYNKAAK
ncbi:MAG: OmpH family outer membrane protein [Candidatus Omnitrophota bacterium]|nr:OmpH family outer membrane protein [Candidatus Omnitrophota bacterium]MDZ4242420.1 OmpH family outer membrane protein [Candidatus Omnitrophota bacterium]